MKDDLAVFRFKAAIFRLKAVFFMVVLGSFVTES